jgi:hypothetical protein
MKRNLIAVLSLVAMSVLLTATGAYAQSFAKANVPFEFKVGNAQLPAGTYEIKVDNASSGAILIENDETSASALSSARREFPRSTNAKLVFHRVGNQYFLAEVWRSSDAEGMIVPTCKQEKQLEKELQTASGNLGGYYQEIVVALD